MDEISKNSHKPTNGLKGQKNTFTKVANNINKSRDRQNKNAHNTQVLDEK